MPQDSLNDARGIDEAHDLEQTGSRATEQRIGFMHFLYSAHPGGPPAGRAFIPATEMLHFSKRWRNSSMSRTANSVPHFLETLMTLEKLAGVKLIHTLVNLEDRFRIHAERIRSVCQHLNLQEIEELRLSPTHTDC
jgi:hypothetical protein